MGSEYIGNGYGQSRAGGCVGGVGCLADVGCGGNACGAAVCGANVCGVDGCGAAACGINACPLNGWAMHVQQTLLRCQDRFQIMITNK